MLLAKLTSRELTGKVFHEIKNSNSFTSIATIDAESTGKLVRRRHLYSLLWLPEKHFVATRNEEAWALGLSTMSDDAVV